MTADPIGFVKGHGTGNDFVIVTDLEGSLEVTANHVRAVCDRHRGLGADGMLVVRRTSSTAEVADQAGVAPYFMDYRNADGSVAEMCGNGARVFVKHLLSAGLAGPGSVSIATRGGARRATTDAAGERIVVDMGPPVLMDIPDLLVAVGADSDELRRWQAVGVLMPNPHAVAWVDDVADAGDLFAAPVVSPGHAFPEGVNVEFVRDWGPQHIQMRVFERGVGETLSCGTGACAAALATLRRRGGGPGSPEVRVDVPGGSLTVRWRAEGTVELGGPAELVAEGTLAAGWWERHG